MEFNKGKSTQIIEKLHRQYEKLDDVVKIFRIGSK